MNTHPLLSDLARFGVRLGLDRMAGFLAWLGDPHVSSPAIHVAGTNGKGSVVQFCASALAAGGRRVGAYTSPHLQRVNERVAVNGEEVEDSTLDALLAELDGARRAWVTEALDGAMRPGEALTYFEMMTALALVYFHRQQVEVSVIEVGLGGRLDATNLVQPAVSVITTVGLDHTEQLGPDLASIAGEKAGIIKPERPVVVGRLPPAALRVVRSIAAEREAPLYVLGEDFRVATERSGRMSWTMGERHLRDLEVGLMGLHQHDNAAVALAALSLLPEGLSVGEEALRVGLSQVRHPGRLEQLDDDLLVDCAHNPDSAVQLAAWLRENPRAPDQQRTLLLGMSSDKDPRTVVVALAPHFDRVLTTHCDHRRALSAGDLAERLVGVDVPVLPAGPVEQALPLARRAPGTVVVAGSVFLAGAVRELLGR